MTATEQIELWIEKYGTARDALNAALAKLNTLEEMLVRLRESIGDDDDRQEESR